MKLKFIAAVSIALAASTASAADSAWLLCENGKLVVNSLEHRTAQPGQRETNLAMIFGMHILQGSLKGSDSGRISLVDSSTRDIKKFRGKVSIDYSKYEMKLTGNLNLYGQVEAIDATLPCKLMN